MKEATLAFLIREEYVLLPMKKRGFGAGYYNGLGGKRLPNETLAQTCSREVKEESEILILPEKFELVGLLCSRFPDKPDLDQDVTIYLARNWNGEPCETEEMRPAFFPLNQIPYDKMWKADPHWIPIALSGTRFKAEFSYASDQTITSKKIILL